MRASLTDDDESTDQAPMRWPNGRARGVQRLNHRHDALVDALLLEPAITQRQLAERFGLSAGWISQVLASGAFQARLAERTAELVDPAIVASIEERLRGLVLRSLEVVREKLDRVTPEIPDHTALRALELSTRALGYGAGLQQPVVRENPDQYLEQHADRLVRLLRRAKAEAAGQTIDGETGPS